MSLHIRDHDWDEAQLARFREERRSSLRVYTAPALTVVLGRGSRPERELHRAACRADGVDLTRRRGGGCAVVLSPGDVVVSYVAAMEGLGHNLEHFRALSHWVIAALERLGVPGVRQRGISDLALGDRKVGGSCLYRTHDLLYYALTLAVQPDIDAMERYLPHPPREPDYRRGRDHAAFVGALSPPGPPPPRMAVALERALRSAPPDLQRPP